MKHRGRTSECAPSKASLLELHEIQISTVKPACDSLHDAAFDEPESALSPQRQLTLLAWMHRLAAENGSQVVIATHSPILLTFPDAALEGCLKA